MDAVGFPFIHYIFVMLYFLSWVIVTMKCEKVKNYALKAKDAEELSQCKY